MCVRVCFFFFFFFAIRSNCPPHRKQASTSKRVTEYNCFFFCSIYVHDYFFGGNESHGPTRRPPPKFAHCQKCCRALYWVRTCTVVQLICIPTPRVKMTLQLDGYFSFAGVEGTECVSVCAYTLPPVTLKGCTGSLSWYDTVVFLSFKCTAFCGNSIYNHCRR